jgi:hypothetical protein
MSNQTQGCARACRRAAEINALLFEHLAAAETHQD